MSMPIAFEMQIRGDSEVKNKLTGIGGALTSLDKQAGAAAMTATQVERNYGQAALGLSAAASGVASLAFQFDDLEKKELRVQQAEQQVDSARATFLTNQAAVNKLITEGITTGDQYEAAQLRLSAASQQLAISQEKVSQAQGDLSQGQMQFALSVVPSVFAGVQGVSGAMKALGITMDLTRLKTMFTAPPMLTLNGVLGGTAASAGAAGGAMGFLRTAMTFIANHPLILPLTAVATVLTLVASNAFGLRDALDSFAKSVEQVFPVIKPVFDFFRFVASTLFPDAAQEAATMQTQFDQQFAAMSANVLQSTGEQAGALGTLGNTFAQFQANGSTQLNTLADTMDSTADSIVADASRIDRALGGAGISIASPSITKTAGAPPSTRTIPNPIGPDLTVPASYFGSFDISKLRASGGIVNVVNVIELDGEVIARKTNKYSTSGMLGMT